MNNNFTTIRITKEIRNRLKTIGKKGEEYIDVLNRLMEIEIFVKGYINDPKNHTEKFVKECKLHPSFKNDH